LVDRLAELDLAVVPYDGGEAPIDKGAVRQPRAEDYWTLRELFQQDEIDLDSEDDKLAAQLGSFKCGMTPAAGSRQSPKKRHAQARLAVTRQADALAMAFAGRANAAPMNVESHAVKALPGI